MEPDTVTEIFMESFFHDVIGSNTSTKKIATRDDAIKRLSPNAYAFRVFERLIAFVSNKHGVLVELTSEPQELSGMFYPSGKIYTLDELKQNRIKGHEDILIENMEMNNWKRVVLDRHGGYAPFGDNDSIV